MPLSAGSKTNAFSAKTHAKPLRHYFLSRKHNNSQKLSKKRKAAKDSGFSELHWLAKLFVGEQARLRKRQD